MSRSSLHAAIVILLSLLPCVAYAQETTGRLIGQLVNAKREPIPGASVVVQGPALQGARGALSGPEGEFTILALPVGNYTVRIQHLAYRPWSGTARVGVDRATSLGTIELTDRVLEAEEIVVTGQASMIDPTSTVVGASLSAEEYEALPVDRDYKSVVSLLPHANASALGDPVNFAGATGLENRYFIEGIDVTDPFRNATATDLPYNFVQEVQVRTGGYEAEYRSSLGGTVNVVTYSGGNEVQGRAFGFYTSDAFSSTPRHVPGTPDAEQDFTLYDVGFGIGGPIVRDQLWYFGAYNPSLQNEDVAIPGFGNFDDGVTSHRFAAKMKWRASDVHTLTFTSIGDPTTADAVDAPVVAPANIDPFLFDRESGGVSFLLAGEHLLDEHLLVRSSLSRTTRKENSVPATEIGRSQPFFVDSTGVISGGGPQNIDRSDVNMIALSGTWLRGDHEWKAGTEFRDGDLEFDNRSDILIETSATAYYSQTSSFQGTVGSRSLTFYLQDSWRATSRLQVNAGVRWDGQYWISSQDEVAQSILDQWQPRVGVSYQLGKIGTQKIYASAGRFYQDLTTSPLFWYFNENSTFRSATYDHDPRNDPSGAQNPIDVTGAIQAELEGLEGQHFDEVSVGYERQVAPSLKLAARGLHRILRQGIEDGFDYGSGAVGLSNPGLGALQAFPDMVRKYSALELSLQGALGSKGSVVGSYVLSRNYGNYEGLFDSYYNNPYPNTTGLYDVTDELVNAKGLLPNDRTHVLKLSGSYRIGRGIEAGISALLQSGTPTSELGGTPIGGIYHAFIDHRGAYGRTPTVWDLNLRFGYEPHIAAWNSFHPKLTLDLFHVASQREEVRIDEIHYNALDDQGNQIDPNPNFGASTAFQPPMAVRIGMEATF